MEPSKKNLLEIQNKLADRCDIPTEASRSEIFEDHSENELKVLPKKVFGVL